MKIVVARPPNFDAIDAVFHVSKRRGVLFCYGDTIFNPDGVAVSEAIKAHEAVHSLRQAHDPAAWWGRYLVDAEFRFNEELPAHDAEYRWHAEQMGISRNQRRVYLRMIATRLASSLYGNIVTVHRAKELILKGSRE